MTQGSSEDPSSSPEGAESGEDGFDLGSSEGPGVGSIDGGMPGDEAGGDGVAFAYRGEEVPPPPDRAVGWYHFDAPRVNHPPDPVTPFIAPPRKRRRDWPVLVFALVIAALALAVCCLAGFALFASRAPFVQ